ncbi:AAA family ATPase [Nonomuraea pusilla]|uniref:AAA family ATPase n=1 Tax=Nonomuraea pusilla TaxID=46177 RepID=UPI000B83DCF5
MDTSTADFGKTYAIANQKGGVGKVATTIDLGGVLAEQDDRVLIQVQSAAREWSSERSPGRPAVADGTAATSAGPTALSPPSPSPALLARTTASGHSSPSSPPSCAAAG